MKLLGWWDEGGWEVTVRARRRHRSVGGTGDGDEAEEVDLGLLMGDVFVCILWVWSGLLLRVLAHDVFGGGEPLRWLLYVVSMFAFARIGSLTGGGAYHPLTVLAHTLSGGSPPFRAAVVWRFLAQVAGYAIGAAQVRWLFPGAARGPDLKVGVLRGALTEGALSFALVIAYLGLREAAPSNPVRICVTGVCRLTLRRLGAGSTGGAMNPAMAFGWELHHMSKELFYVYCLVPFAAAASAVWTFLRVTKPKSKKWD